jgi:hypothetical protein
MASPPRDDRARIEGRLRLVPLDAGHAASYPGAAAARNAVRGIEGGWRLGAIRAPVPVPLPVPRVDGYGRRQPRP